MKIKLVTRVYNESYLLPIFIKNYRNIVDRFVFYVDKDTTDKSIEAIQLMLPESAYDIIIHDFGFDDVYFFEKIMLKEIQNHKGRIISVDCDEIIIDGIPNDECVNVMFYQMRRHEGEPVHVDWRIPLIEQRKYGTVDVAYNKPCVFVGGNKYKYHGCHVLQVLKGQSYVPVENKDCIRGMHLNMINENFAIKRHNERVQRIPMQSLERGIGRHYINRGNDFIRNYRKGICKLF